MHRLPCKRQTLPLPRVLFLILSMIFVGCGSESNYQFVDFQDHVEVARPVAPPPAKAPLKVAVAAMISPRETVHYYRALLDYLAVRMGQRIDLVQRKTYGEINDLFLKQQLDLAFICTGPYATAKDVYGFEAIATPQVRGQPTYQSYLIVKMDSDYGSLQDLRGKAFAFTDPDSNTGSLVPRFWLAEIGESPATFFRQTIYTYSHDNSIKAVARGLVAGAAVDGHKWEYYREIDPGLTAATRIIKKSEPFGAPPLVAASRLSPEKKAQIQAIVTSMHLDKEGRAILARLMSDRFVVPEEAWYASVKRMHRVLQTGDKASHAAAQSQ